MRKRFSTLFMQIAVVKSEATSYERKYNIEGFSCHANDCTICLSHLHHLLEHVSFELVRESASSRQARASLHPSTCFAATDDFPSCFDRARLTNLAKNKCHWLQIFSQLAKIGPVTEGEAEEASSRSPWFNTDPHPGLRAYPFLSQVCCPPCMETFLTSCAHASTLAYVYTDTLDHKLYRRCCYSQCWLHDKL